MVFCCQPTNVVFEVPTHAVASCHWRRQDFVRGGARKVTKLRENNLR